MLSKNLYRLYRSSRFITTLKKYKDGHLGFAQSSNGDYNFMKSRKMVDCWFLSEEDVKNAAEIIGLKDDNYTISKARKIPDNPLEIKINDLIVVIDGNDTLSSEFISNKNNSVDENFIYEKIGGTNLIDNRSSEDAIHITIKSYKDKQTLFDIKQEKDEDDLHFYVRIENGRETFEYSRKIETQEDLCKALEQTINALENYNEFYEQRDELIDILEKFE